MKRIYVAGPYNAANVIDVLSNVRVGIDTSIKAIEAGFSVFCPFLDFHYGLISSLSIEQYRANSMAWVAVSDAILLLPGWQRSEGVREELRVASIHGIPSYESLDELQNALGS